MAASKISPQDVYIYGLDTEENEPQSPYFDERINLAIDPNKVKNVLALGCKVPLLLKKAKKGEIEGVEKGSLVVVDGRQRTRWCREANVLLEAQGEPPIVMTYVLETGSDDQIEAVSVATNAAREDDTLLVRARKAKRLCDRGYTTAQVAVHCATSAQTVRNWLKVLELPKYLQSEVERGTVTMTAALKLGKSEDPKAALAEHKEEAEAKSEAKSEGARGKPTRPKKPLKKWREAMALDENSALGQPAYYMLAWLTGHASTEECEQYVPGFKESLKKAKSRVKRKENTDAKRDAAEALTAGEAPTEPEPEDEPEAEAPDDLPEETPEPKAKTKKKTKKKKTPAKAKTAPVVATPEPKGKKSVDDLFDDLDDNPTDTSNEDDDW